MLQFTRIREINLRRKTPPIPSKCKIIKAFIKMFHSLNALHLSGEFFKGKILNNTIVFSVYSNYKIHIKRHEITDKLGV